MKSFIYGLLITLALCTGLYAVSETMVSPAATFTSSGLKTSSAAISTGIGAMGGVILYTDGTNDETIVVYDNASASSGTVLFKGTCIGSNYSCAFAPAWPVAFTSGIYAYLTGSGTPTYIIYYDNRGK